MGNKAGCSRCFGNNFARKMSTVFDQIIAGEIPADILLEDEHLIAFRDIHPIAPVHVLIVPKETISSFHALEEKHYHLLGKIVSAAQLLANRLSTAASGYRLLTNVGKDAGQTVAHLHFHLIGGHMLAPLGYEQ